MAESKNTFQLWLGRQDEPIRRLVESEKLKGKSESEILKELIYRGMARPDKQIMEILKQLEEIKQLLSNKEDKP